MYSYCCLCILIVRPCILIVVYVFLSLSTYSYCCLRILIVVYVFLLLSTYSYRCLCILIVVYVFLSFSMYSYCSSMYSYCSLCILIVVYVFLDAATLTKVFPSFFLGCKANARVYPANTWHGPHSSKIVALFYVLFICKCVLYLCYLVTTQLQLKNVS
jgi:hypothetical protein